jgi:NAD(P)-dependent dehydrogenase (short-subunit alcohol dehydrogenase family)
MTWGAATTTDELLAGYDLTGKTAVVTGGTGGIGEDTVRALASVGAHVVMSGRDEHKAAEALDRIRTRHPTASVEFERIDLLSLDSVRTGAANISSNHRVIDLLVNNAGIMAGPFRHTADGHEAQFGVNHLAHFVLTTALTPNLLAARESRIVNLSSAGHAFGGFDLDDVDFERRPYTGFAGYGQSKTANILFSVALDHRYRAQGCRSAAVHPGGIQTELGRNFTDDDKAAIAKRLAARPEGADGFVWKSPAQGAATTIWAAVVADGDDIGGRYCEDCHASEPTTPAALNLDTAERLWELSEQLATR